MSSGDGADWLLGGAQQMGDDAMSELPIVEVYAAGGVLWRRGDDGLVELLVVHRPRYDDWSFPKGKRDLGETDEACAMREVTEETGLVGEPGIELATSYYRDRKGRSKQVRYWAMTVRDVAPQESDEEVDVMRWLPLDQVEVRLSYERDRPVFDSFCALVACGRL